MVRTGYLIAGAAVIVILFAAILLVSRPATVEEQTILDSDSEITYARISANSVTDLQGIQFDVTFDPAVVAYTGISDGAFLNNQPGNPLVYDALKKETGAVRNIILLRTTQPGVSGTGLVAEVKFVRVGPGEPKIQLQNVLVSDSKGNPIDSDAISLLVN